MTKESQFGEKLKQARKIVRQHMKTAEGKDKIPEAETSRRVEEVLTSLCGYDALTHLSREKRVSKGISDAVDFAVIIPPTSEVRLVVEVKSVSRGLSDAMYNQVRNYAHAEKCEWTLLTDSKEWRLLHVDISGSGDVSPVEEWNLFDDTPVKLERCFGIISLGSVKKGRLAKVWEAKRPLQPEVLAKVLVSQRVLNGFRRELKERGFSAPELYDLSGALANELLKPEHGVIAKRAYRPDSKTSGKKSVTRRKQETDKQPAQPKSHDTHGDN